MSVAAHISSRNGKYKAQVHPPITIRPSVDWSKYELAYETRTTLQIRNISWCEYSHHPHNGGSAFATILQPSLAHQISQSELFFFKYQILYRNYRVILRDWPEASGFLHAKSQHQCTYLILGTAGQEESSSVGVFIQITASEITSFSFLNNNTLCGANVLFIETRNIVFPFRELCNFPWFKVN